MAAHKKNCSPWLKVGKIAIVVLFSLTLFVLASDWIYSHFFPQSKVEYGVTFSVIQAQNLNLPADTLYQNMLDDLNVKKLRLPLYWDTIEKSDGKFDFSLYDKLLGQAAAKGVKVILVVGYKVPRWPECFAPQWTQNLPSDQFETKIQQLVKVSVNHFKNRPEVVAWQVENEPLLNFGVCRHRTTKDLKQEVEVVKKADSRPVIVTDAGERDWWIIPMQIGDIFGTTLYRTVWDKTFGELSYPIPAVTYPARYWLMQTFLAQQNKGIIISELQAEGWPAPNESTLTTPVEDQIKTFPLTKFKDVLNYAAATHISEQYLWGVEWWYFMKEHGHPEYWNFAKTLF